jgi:hypothetical protein
MRETNKDATIATTTVRERDMNLQKGVTMITMDKRKGHEYDEETKEGRQYPVNIVKEKKLRTRL